MDIILIGSLASLLAGLATSIGALPIFFMRGISDRLLDVMLGFSAGIMLAATSFSLLIPAMEIGGLVVSVLGIAFGAITINLMDRFIPHMHIISGLEGPTSRIARVWLLIIAMTIHNFPEGMAVGVSFGTGDVSTGLVVAMAIGLQNMPEGLAVAMPLLREGRSRSKAFLYATATGLVEPVGGFLGVSIVSLSANFLPWGLAFAAGAMLYVVSDEMIPESHRREFASEATLGLISGFIVMMFLDSLFS
ncbi:MAG: ZIP family metal transporter [Candidatus Odinarchaeota archaeon]|nr:ZIP family metal transporter [Candidatus Odinarchaeota archaeon]